MELFLEDKLKQKIEEVLSCKNTLQGYCKEVSTDSPLEEYNRTDHYSMHYRMGSSKCFCNGMSQEQDDFEQFTSDWQRIITLVINIEEVGSNRAELYADLWCTPINHKWHAYWEWIWHHCKSTLPVWYQIQVHTHTFQDITIIRVYIL